MYIGIANYNILYFIELSIFLAFLIVFNLSHLVVNPFRPVILIRPNLLKLFYFTELLTTQKQLRKKIIISMHPQMSEKRRKNWDSLVPTGLMYTFHCLLKSESFLF